MISTVFFIFFVVLFISFFPIKFRVINNTIIIAVGLVLILIAGLRDNDVASDYSVYMMFWQQRDLTGLVEQSFIWIRQLLKDDLSLPSIYLFLVYAIIGVGTKIYAINKISPYPFLCILVYIGHYYILHDLTQIRIGAGAGFFLIAIYYKTQQNLRLTILFLCIATFFHYSAAVGFILLFLNNKSVKFYYFLIPLGYLLYFFNTQVEFNIPIPYIQQKIDIYKEMKKYGLNKSDEINLFNFVLLARILIVYFLFYCSKKISQHYEYIYLFVKIYCISLFAFVFLADNPSFSFRIQEFLGIIEIVLIPLLAFAFTRRFWGKLLVVSIAFTFICIDIFYNNYIFK